jgi:hypothetical protein
VALARLEQWTTYGGLLAGRPNAQLNHAHLEDLASEAARYAPMGGKPHVLVPADSEIASSLPGVTCVAVLNSGPLARNDSEPYSSLAIGWFQDRFAFPLDPEIEKRIRQLDWDSLAKDWLS